MTPPHRDQFDTVVTENAPLCREHFRLTLRLDRFPPTEPGQFVQVACRDLGGRNRDEMDSPWAMLRRPFSLASRRDDPGQGVYLELIGRVVGVGTAWMAARRPGDTVNILGPLGNRFDLPPAGATAILVGGGVGIPPMLYLAEYLRGRKAIAFCGALSRDLLPLTVMADAKSGYEIHEFSRHGIPCVVSTDDGSFGFHGLVTAALERHLDTASDLAGAVVYTCGPEGMMKRVAQIAAAHGLESQVAVERAMACGMGTCQSCCIRVRKPEAEKPPLPGSSWCYRLTCTDGPVFRGAQLLW